MGQGSAGAVFLCAVLRFFLKPFLTDFLRILRNSINVFEMAVGRTMAFIQKRYTDQQVLTSVEKQELWFCTLWKTLEILH